MMSQVKAVSNLNGSKILLLHFDFRERHLRCSREDPKALFVDGLKLFTSRSSAASWEYGCWDAFSRVIGCNNSMRSFESRIWGALPRTKYNLLPMITGNRLFFSPHVFVKEPRNSERHFASVSDVQLEAIPPTKITNVERASSGNAGESVHTKLAAVLGREKPSTTFAGKVSLAAVAPMSYTGQDSRTTRREELSSSAVTQKLRREKSFLDAWQFFRMVEKQDGFQHGTETYSIMLLLLCQAGKYDIVSELLRTVREAEISLTTGTCLQVAKSFVWGQFYDRAVAFFQSLSYYGCYPNLEMYSLYLDSLLRTGQYDLLKATLDGKMREVIVPDIDDAGRWEKVLQVYGELKLKGAGGDYLTFDAVIRPLVMVGKINEALEIFFVTVEKGMAVSEFSYSSLIFQLDKHRNLITDSESPQRDVSSWSKGKGISCDESSLTAYRGIVWTIAKTPDTGRVLQTLKEVELLGRKIPLGIYKMLLIFLAQASENHAVVDLFERLKTKNDWGDALTYRFAVEAACRARDSERGLLLFYEMRRKGFVGKLSTWNSLISITTEAGNLDSAVELYKDMLQSSLPKGFVYNSLMQDLCRFREPNAAAQWLAEVGVSSGVVTPTVTQALKLYEHMKSMNILDATTYETLIRGMCQAGKVKDVQRLLQESQENGFIQGVSLYNRVLSILSAFRKIDAAWEIFQTMRVTNLPDSVTYAILIKLLVKAGRLGKATTLLDEMKKSGLAPSSTAYKALALGFAQAKRLVECKKVSKEMPQRAGRADRPYYVSLIEAYCKSGRVAYAYRLFEESVEMGVSPDSSTYTTLIGGFFKSYNSRDAIDTYKQMKAIGCKPSRLTYNILLKGLTKAKRMGMLEVVVKEIDEVGVAVLDVDTNLYTCAVSHVKRWKEIASKPRTAIFKTQ